MEEPLATYKGDRFERVKIYKDRVVCEGRDGKVSLSLQELPFLLDRECTRTSCRWFVQAKELYNCCLNVDRSYSFDEIGKALGGMRRQRIEQIVNGSETKGHTEKSLLTKFRKRLVKATKNRTFTDFLPDPPLLPHKKKNKEVDDL